MRVLIGAALGAAGMLMVGTSAITPAAASDAATKVQHGSSASTAVEDFSARRRYRRYYRPGPAYYSEGPVYYRPSYGYGGYPYRPYGYGGPGYYSRPGISFGFGF